MKQSRRTSTIMENRSKKAQKWELELDRKIVETKEFFKLIKEKHSRSKIDEIINDKGLKVNPQSLSKCACYSFSNNFILLFFLCKKEEMSWPIS